MSFPSPYLHSSYHSNATQSGVLKAILKETIRIKQSLSIRETRRMGKRTWFIVCYELTTTVNTLMYLLNVLVVQKSLSKSVGVLWPRSRDVVSPMAGCTPWLWSGLHQASECCIYSQWPEMRCRISDEELDRGQLCQVHVTVLGQSGPEVASC